MERYYYHGVTDLLDEVSIDVMLSIIRSGEIKTRNVLGNRCDEKYNHVCLYKKNEKIDYTKEENYYRSARSGWIDHCFVFIIDSNIKAVAERKIENTNLIDEWRSIGAIPLEKIVGIAIPFDSIEELKKQISNLGDSFDQKMERLLNIAKENNWLVVNSDEYAFCDRLDNELNNIKTNK